MSYAARDRSAILIRIADISQYRDRELVIILRRERMDVSNKGRIQYEDSEGTDD